ncbi:MAG: citryl-CoA lyase [Gammaproteobacteria bacterium]|nr:citryl-CoA lyase [Gammaproteobacteria bacterium]
MSEEVIHSKIWNEVAEADNPFQAKQCLVSGYDVYGDLLGKASWIDYLYLLFKLERPTPEQARLLETLAIAIANPGIRDHSVRAANCAGVGGSTAASCLMAALAVGAGQLGGAREVFLAMQTWQTCGRDIDKWRQSIVSPEPEERADVWPEIEHPPGFDPHGASCPAPVRQTLSALLDCHSGGALEWLDQNRITLENHADCPLAMTGVSAAALTDLDMTPEQGEMLFLLLRLPGAAAHSLEQRDYGWRKYPFFGDSLILTDDPGPPAASNSDTIQT